MKEIVMRIIKMENFNNSSKGGKIVRDKRVYIGKYPEFPSLHKTDFIDLLDDWNINEEEIFSGWK